MKVRLISQPFDDGEDLRQFLAALANDARVRELTIVVAWAKRSGFRQVGELFATLRARGVKVRMIVGIDEGGATRQGLQAVIEHSDEAFVYHVAGRTFHPKLYLGTGDREFISMIGSHNLTRGGTVENFELGLIAESEQPDDGAGLLDQLLAYVDRLLKDHAVCRQLNDATYKWLLNAYPIGDEDASDRGADDTIPGTRSGDESADGNLFGTTRYQLRRGTSVRPSGVGHRDATGRQGTFLAGPESQTMPSSAVQPARRWVKELKAADAQRLGGASNPTGHVTLVRAHNPITNAADWFRQSFFRGAVWEPVPHEAGRERATVEFEVVIDGVSRGRQALVVDFNPRFESNQSNRVATLRWGDDLNKYLHHDADRRGDSLTLEAFDDGTYRLIIDSNNTRQPIP